MSLRDSPGKPLGNVSTTDLEYTGILVTAVASFVVAVAVLAPGKRGGRQPPMAGAEERVGAASYIRGGNFHSNPTILLLIFPSTRLI